MRFAGLAALLVPPDPFLGFPDFTIKRVAMKKKILAIAAILLVVVGLGVLLYPTFNDLYSRWQAEQTIKQYTYVAQPETKVDYSDLWKAAEEYNRMVAEKGVFSQEALTQDVSKLLNPLGNGMMGYIDIPKINVHLPIYQGTEEKELQSGCGWWIGTSLPTGGESTHCVITGHTGLTKAKMFTDIDQLKIGDTFSLSVLDRTLTYQVDQILTVLPENVEPLQIEKGKDYVTLYTCTPYGVNTHRLLVRGHRIPTPAAAAETPTTDGPSTAELVIFAALLVAAVIAIILIVRAIRRRRRLRDPENHYLDPRAARSKGRLKDRRPDRHKNQYTKSKRIPEGVENEDEKKE